MASHIISVLVPLCPDAELCQVSHMWHDGCEMHETYHRVPGASAETECVVADTETADSVVVALQCAYTLAT